MRRVLTIAAATAVLLGGRVAGAYCQSATCAAEGSGGGSMSGQVCDPSLPSDCGIPLQWRQPCVSFDVQQGASSHIDFATADATLTQAFATWQQLACGGGMPSIQVFDFGSVSCNKTEYNQQAGNANILIFRDDEWPHDISGDNTDVLALTTVTYDTVTGDIYDADIEVNTFDFTFTTGDSPGPDDYDLLSVLTHETGHFLGLAHSQTTAATMYRSYQGIVMRHPQQDDVNAVCSAYPVDRQATGACTGIPRHGWSPLCADQQPNVTCDLAGGHPEPRGLAGHGAFALALIAALRMRGRVRGRRGSRRS
jgi:Matrixin